MSHLGEPFYCIEIEDDPRRDLAAARDICELV